MLVMFTDNLIVSRLGEVELAAASLSTSITSILLVFGIGFSIPISALAAQAMGERNDAMLKQVFWHGMVQVLLVGLLLAGLGQLIPWIVGMTDQDPRVMELAAPMMQYLAWSLFPLMIYQGFRQFIEGMGDTRPAMVVGLLTVALNIGFNYLFIYGWGPVNAMGVAGSGMASLVARIFLAIALGGYFLQQSQYRPILAGAAAVNWAKSVFGKLVKLGMPISLQMLFEVAVFGIAAVIIGKLGAAPLAAHQAVLTVAGLTYMAASGLGTATTIRTGYYYGARMPQALKTASLVGVNIAVIYMLGMALLIVALNQVLPYMFLSSADTVSLASQLFLLAALFQVADGAQVVILGALRGMNDVKRPTLITLIAYWVLAMPVGYVLAIHTSLGAYGMWIGFTVGLFFAAINLYFRLQKRLRQFAANPVPELSDVPVMAH